MYKTLYFLTEGMLNIDTSKNLLYQAATLWRDLIKYRYVFTYGYKRRTYDIYLIFDESQFSHLAGFQYLKDLQLPKYNSKKIMEKVLDQKIKQEQIEKGKQYNEMVKPRLEALIHLQEGLDSEFQLFAYEKRNCPFSTTIDANYLISYSCGDKSFLFVAEENTRCTYICRSAFLKGERDYESNQRKVTLLRKERIYIPSGESIVYLDNIKVKS